MSEERRARDTRRVNELRAHLIAGGLIERFTYEGRPGMMLTETGIMAASALFRLLPDAARDHMLLMDSLLPREGIQFEVDDPRLN